VNTHNSDHTGPGLPEIAASNGVRKLLEPLVHLVLDVDGTLALDETLLPSTAGFLATLEDLGITFTVVTNNSSRSKAEHGERLRRMGMDIKTDSVIVSTEATLDYLAAAFPGVKRLFLLGPPAFQSEFSEQGFELCADDPEDEPDAVVVGFDTSLTYDRLCRAAYWIKQGKRYFATHPDLVCPTDRPTVLVDCGSIISCLKAATGREPDAILGKPSPQMLHTVRNRHGLKCNQIAMVGDRLYTDMAMAHAAEVPAILVLCGESTREEGESARPAPDLIVADPGELSRLLVMAKRNGKADEAAIE
jgi:HAD superfamily hydrolase (TIGR01450 family)